MTPTERDVVRLYRTMVPIVDIARQVGMSESGIHRMLRRLDVPTRGRSDGHAPWGDVLTRRRLEAAADEGMTAHALAVEVGCPRASIVWWAARRGVLAYAGIGEVSPGEMDHARRLYKEGQSIADVATVLGRDVKSIGIILRAAGATIRPRGRRHR